MALHAYRENGTEVRRGDTIENFRGDSAVFLAATRAPDGHRTGKVLVSTDRMDSIEYYMGVYSLTVRDEPYDAEQVTSVLELTTRLMVKAAGYNPLSGYVPERAHYTRGDVLDPLDIAANVIGEGYAYETSASIRAADMANLSVNITGWLLDHLGRLGDVTIEEIISDQYSTDPEEVLGWVS